MQNNENDALPRIWCDFNARGWSGENDDYCYYVFRDEELKKANPSTGKKVLIYMEDEPNRDIEIVGTIEKYKNGWRVRPDEN